MIEDKRRRFPAVDPTQHKRMQPLTLRRNFSYTFLGSVVNALANWLMLTVFAKLGTSEMVGIYALGLAVTQPIIAFTQLQLRTVQATDAKEQFRFSDYLGIRLLTTVGALVIMAIVAVVGPYDEVAGWVIMVVGFGAALDSISDVIYGLLQQYQRMDRIAISMSIKGPLSLLLLTIGLIVKHNVIWACAGSALASAVVVFGYDIFSPALILRSMIAEAPRSADRLQDRFEKSIHSGHAAYEWKPRWNWPVAREIMLLSLPLGIAMMLVALNTNIPRYFIEHCQGSAKLGIFAALASFISVGKIVVNALGQATIPKLAQAFAEHKRRQFVALLLKLVALSALLGAAAPLLAFVGGKPALSLLYTSEYPNDVKLFAVILACGGIGYVGSALGFGMTATRDFAVQVPYLTCVTIVSLLTAYLLIPTHGLMGAAVSMGITAAVQIVLGFWVMLHLLRRGYAAFPNGVGAVLPRRSSASNFPGMAPRPFARSDSAPNAISLELTRRPNIQPLIQSSLCVVTIVILSHRRKDCIQALLSSVLPISARHGYEVIVVDNGSDDGSQEFLLDRAAEWPELRVILNRENRGVGNGRNDGFRFAGGRYIICLDDDSIIDEAGLAAIPGVFAENPDAGILTFRVRHPLSGNWECDHGDQRKHVANFHGAGHAFRSDVFKEVGYLDPECTYGAEELDMSIRAYAAGYATLYVPDIVVDHIKKTEWISVNCNRRLTWVYNYVRVLRKHFSYSCAAEFAIRFTMRHVVATLVKGNVALAVQLPFSAVRGWKQGATNHTALPNDTIEFYRTPGLRPDFGNTPIASRYRELRGSRNGTPSSSGGDERKATVQ